MADLPVSDYGFLSDCRSAALVSRAGSIHWWCPDRFDSSPVFARLLDPHAGHWTLAPTAYFTPTGSTGMLPTTGLPMAQLAATGAPPAGRLSVERAYLDDTLVLRTVHHTPYGSVAVTDALATRPGARGHELGRDSPAVLLREVRGLTGRVPMRCEFAPRPEFGMLTPYLHATVPGRVVAAAGPTTLTLRADVPLTCRADSAVADFAVAAGQRVGFSAAYAPAYGAAPVELDPETALPDTVAAWRSLENSHRYDGRYAEAVRRSALVLQGLTYVPSGAVAAAATTSLPELPGADRNYDYRFSWLRDFAFTMRALWVAACPDETDRLFAWAARSAGRITEHPVPIMYGLGGERDLSEHPLNHLRGYAESRPVRVGNDAWRQHQLDVPGEVLAAAYRLRDQLGTLDVELRDMLVGLADQVTRTWQRPDAGMWEVRNEERHYLSSKVMCWVALDRAVRMAPVLGDRADPRRWGKVADQIRATVLAEGWHHGTGAFTGAFGSPELDASVLILPVVGFLPATDRRMRATIERIEQRLTSDGLVRRWAGDPAGFILCTCWLVECLMLAGEEGRAQRLLERVLRRGNDLGLFSEQIDQATGAQLGNTPQALSHIGLINAAWRLTEPDDRD